MLDNLFSAFCAALLGIAMLISVPQIVGTWQSGHVVLQIFADGHYEVDTNGDTVSDIYGGYLLSPHNDHPPVLAVLDTGGPSMCRYGEIGYYWVEKASKGALRLTVVQDPCVDRSVMLSNRWKPRLPPNTV